MKIAFIGAGSLGFTRKIVSDLLTVPELRHRLDIRFTDISRRNLDMVYRLVRRDMEANRVRSRLSATLDRREALEGARYVFCVVRVGGLDAFQLDIDIPLKYIPQRRSKEHSSYIVEGIETGRVYRGHFNVLNQGCISNLPADAIVEAPGYVDANGLNIPRVGALPTGCAAVCNASISVQRLAVEAAISGDDTILRQAMMMDPLVGAVCNPPEISQMVDEMLVAQARWLPQYKKAVGAVRRRLARTPLLKTRTTRGAARVRTRTVREMSNSPARARAQASAADKSGARTKR